MYDYYCDKCGERHDLREPLGEKHLQYVLNKEGFQRYLEFFGSAGAYGYITQNTQQYVRDVQVFDVLQQKFSNAGMFADRNAAAAWLSERRNVNPDDINQLLRRLQGDGGGEVDAIRQINGGLRGLIHKAELATNGQGQVTSNIPGIDLVVKSRLTGDVIETIQVKSNWTMGSLRGTVQKFLDNAHYDESITLAGPRELIEEARALGSPNKLVVVGDTAGNEASGTRLVKLIERGDAAVDGNFTLEGIASKAGQGALIGGAVAATLGSLSAYLAYRRGDLTGGEAFQRVAVEASRGAIAGTALSGVSVLFPPGLLGVGVGIVVGTQIRRVVDIAYGRGAYQDLLTGMSAVEVSFAAAGASIQVVKHSLSARQSAHETVQKDLWETASLAQDTSNLLKKIRDIDSGDN